MPAATRFAPMMPRAGGTCCAIEHAKRCFTPRELRYLFESKQRTRMGAQLHLRWRFWRQLGLVPNVVDGVQILEGRRGSPIQLQLGRSIAHIEDRDIGPG